ncbi:Glycosyltransferase involved in cell wall bisynthesis [Roseomonas rosea]|uniref:Glycosyltransferase involved in cell wall bisynthesis n=1 Tax=Muricoccus roseus TaxID=198092 RepID=A0A1M6AJI5_9PROT|nr:glycosyltransferase family 4 protein [Roseomonas rosea]SHI36679.1 Glycosyltransferase involved in cell wall bisynthesis [Roseomonas rosea]
MSRPTTGLRLLMTADAAGGIWTYALDLAGGLAAHGVATDLAVIGPDPKEAQRGQAEAIPGLQLHRTGLPLDWLADGPDAVLAAGRCLAALARETGVDLVHLNSPAHAAGGVFPVPLVAVSHSCTATWWDAVRGGALPEDFAWRADLLRRGALGATELVVPSHAFGEMTMRRYVLPRPPVAVHNGRAPLPPAVSRPADAPELFAFTAGRLWDAGKNVGALDRAASRLDLPVLAAGSLLGPDGTRVAAPHLRTLGVLDEAALASWLGCKPIYVSLALYEPFGLAVTEAAQAGCPLVLSDIPTFRELWDGAALFVPPNDEEAAVSAMARLAADGRERLRLGAAARSRAARYTVEAMAASMHAVYRRVLFQGSAAA